MGKRAWTGGLATVVVAIGLIGTGLASAGNPTGFSNGTLSEAVDGSGTGLLANTLVLAGPSNYKTTVCRIARGTSACTAASPITFSSPTRYDRNHGTRVFADTGAAGDWVASISDSGGSAPDQVYASKSSDNGSSWTAATQIGQLPAAPDAPLRSDEPTDLAFDLPGGAIATVSVRAGATNPGVWFQLAPLPPAAAVTASYKLFSVAPGDSGDQVAVGVRPDGKVAVAFYPGDGSAPKLIVSSGTAVSALNSAAGWANPSSSLPAGGYPQMLTSHSHLDLVYKADDGTFNHWVAQRLDAGVGSPVTIPTPRSAALPTFGNGADGSITAVWAGTGEVDALHSAADLSGFSTPVTLACENYGSNPVVAANAADDGFVSYFTGAGGWQSLPLSARASCHTTTTTTTTTTRTTTRTGGPGPLALSRVSQSHRRWRIGRATRHTPSGDTFSFTLNRAATVHLTFVRLATGQRVGRRCLAPSRRRHHARTCQRRISAGGLSRPEPAGRSSFAFGGRIGRHTLTPGKYEVDLVANAGRQRSNQASLRFTIVR